MKRDATQAHANFTQLQSQWDQLQALYQDAIAREHEWTTKNAHLKTELESRLIAYGSHRKSCMTRYKNDTACDCGFVKAMRVV